jgi:hypothetical protein
LPIGWRRRCTQKEEKMTTKLEEYMQKAIQIEEYAQNKTKVRVTFASGNTKWGWIHRYNEAWYLTRGNRVGFSLSNAVKVEEIKG